MIIPSREADVIGPVLLTQGKSVWYIGEPGAFIQVAGKAVMLLGIVLMAPMLYQAGIRHSYAAMRGEFPVSMERPEMRFDDVAGLEEAKACLREAAEFLRDPGRCRRTGARPPKGGAPLRFSRDREDAPCPGGGGRSRGGFSGHHWGGVHGGVRRRRCGAGERAFRADQEACAVRRVYRDEIDSLGLDRHKMH